jgi:hypothetical protein
MVPGHKVVLTFG